MDVDLKSATQLFIWNRQIFSIGGFWPLQPPCLKFYISYLYFVLHVIMTVSDFFIVFGDMSLMIANLFETAIQTMVGVKMMVLRYSIPLKEILKQLMDAGAKEDNYRDQEEKRLYLRYITIGRHFFRTASYLALAPVLILHFKPLKDVIRAASNNETIPYILPYRMHLFFNITDIRTYVLVYISQSPMVYYYYCHDISVCFLCTLVVHVAGEMSVLAHRIRRINQLNSSNDYDDPKIAFREIVKKHEMIIWTANKIDDVFNVVLLEELLMSTGLMALTAYNLLTESLTLSMVEFVYFVNLCASLMLLILVYCINGEFLIHESVNVHDAYYGCRWYEMPLTYRTHMIICMSRAQKPLQLTAGRFYVFSLSRFSGILKSSMAYTSMLRNFV